MFLIELWSVLGTRQRSNVYQTVYLELPENRRGVIPGSIRKSHRVDIERHASRLCRQIFRRINLVGTRRLEDAQRRIESGRVLGMDDGENAALVEHFFEAWSGIFRNPNPSQCTATAGQPPNDATDRGPTNCRNDWSGCEYGPDNRNGQRRQAGERAKSAPYQASLFGSTHNVFFDRNVFRFVVLQQ